MIKYNGTEYLRISTKGYNYVVSEVGEEGLER
jgi:hypothetical protein